jgi:hypothetical protein
MRTPNCKCENCGNDFYKLTAEIKRRKHHFCTVECSNLSKQGKIKNVFEVQCSNCNKAFFKPFCNLKNSDKHFCSRQCFGKFNITQVKVKCNMCKEDFFIKQSRFKKSGQKFFCSRECSSKHHTKKVEVVCLICNKNFLKPFDRIAKRPRHCCSPECAVILVKSLKDWGGRRSKLEIYVEENLKKDFHLNFLFNETTIGYELDIYIPEINYAIEINGITHYEPIYGESIFKRRIEIDQQKLEECKNKNIKLDILNVSRDRNYPNILRKRYLEIKNLILERLKSIEFSTNELVIKN